MLNLLGILLSLVIAESTRGQGIFVGWQSPVAAVIAVAIVLFLYNAVAANVVGRLQLLSLHARAAAAQGMAEAPEIDRVSRAEREYFARRLPAFRLAADSVILVLFYVLCSFFGWPDYVAQYWHVPQHLDLLPNLLPYLGMLAASWVGQFRLEHELRGPSWRPGAFVAFHTRANLMTLAPILIINALYWALLTWVPLAGELREAFAYLDFALQLLLVLVVSVFLPPLVRLVIPSEPLPPGPLRDRLEAFARRRGIRIGQLLVWRTNSRFFATAFVIGLVGPLRYVFFTDAILRRLSADEIEAVLAHELGHAHHRHLWWLLVFLLSFSVLLLAVDELVRMTGSIESQFAGVALALAYGYFAFGYLSRRFERQADAFAARHTSPELISSVLLRIGAGNPAAMRKTGWRHFSISQRVRELALLRHHPEVQARFDGERRKAMGLVAAVTLLAALLLAQPVRKDVVSGLATLSLARFDRARVAGDTAGMNELRQRTLDRIDAMGRLDDDYNRMARWYEGVVQGLSGEQTPALDQLAAEVRRKRDETQDSRERQTCDRWLALVEATEVSMKRAREKGVPFDDELDAELARRGLK